MAKRAGGDVNLTWPQTNQQCAERVEYKMNGWR